MSLHFSEYLKLSLGRNEAFHVKTGQTAPLVRSGIVYQFLVPCELYLVWNGGRVIPDFHCD